MKQIKGFATLFLSMVLISGCSKSSNNDQLNTGDNIIFRVRSQYTSAVNVKLTIPEPDPGSLIVWNSGFVNASLIVFNAVHKNGNALAEERFGANINQSVNLFEPKTLGTINVTKQVCDYASVTVHLAPASSYAMMLNGSYIRPGVIPVTRVQVLLLIAGAVDINSQAMSSVTLDKISYGASLEMSLDPLLNNISADLLNRASVTDGTMIISNEFNRNIYQAIMQNLTDNLMTMDLSPILISSPDPASL